MTTQGHDPWNRELEVRVREALRSIRYGTVTLTLQDGHVIQIDRHEKIRLHPRGDAVGGERG